MFLAENWDNKITTRLTLLYFLGGENYLAVPIFFPSNMRQIVLAYMLHGTDKNPWLVCTLLRQPSLKEKSVFAFPCVKRTLYSMTGDLNVL